MSNPCILANNICPSNVSTINVINNNNCYTGCRELRENKNYHIRELLNRDSDGNDYHARVSNNQKFNDSVKKNGSRNSGIKNNNNKYT